MEPDYYDLLDGALDGVSDADIAAYLLDYGITPKPPTDPKLIADATAAKVTATGNGNSKLVNTLDFILKYGDKALSILSKNGIIKNKNLIDKSYSIDFEALAKVTPTNSAPDPKSRVFNLDFTDPKVLIITFLVLLIIGYFLFFNPSKKNAKR